jgi:hypothetical protein
LGSSTSVSVASVNNRTPATETTAAIAEFSAHDVAARNSIANPAQRLHRPIGHIGIVFA